MYEDAHRHATGIHTDAEVHANPQLYSPKFHHESPDDWDLKWVEQEPKPVPAEPACDINLSMPTPILPTCIVPSVLCPCTHYNMRDHYKCKDASCNSKCNSGSSKVKGLRCHGCHCSDRR